MSDYYTYVHYRSSDGRPFYVGKGKSRRAYSKEFRNQHWHRTVAKHGYNIVIVERGLSNQEAVALEIFLIASFRAVGEPLVNISSGGDGVPGWVPSPETRAKIARANTGRKASEEVRARMSKARAGKPHCLEWVKNQAATMLGRLKTDAHRAALSATFTSERRMQASLSTRRVHAEMTLEQKAERARKISEATRARMADPERKARLIAGIRQSRATSNGK